MERRGTVRTTSGSLFMGLVAVLLAALLVVIAGPGATAATTRSSSSARPALGAVAFQADPIRGLAASLDYDVDRIFRFVSDEIRYEPYSGELRGAVGTLRARAGNSVDKSLLLAALLDASLIPYRFADGPLDTAESTALLETLPAGVEDARRFALPAPPDTGAPPSSDSPGEVTPRGPLEAVYAKQQAALAAQAQVGFQVAATRLRDTVSMLDGALDGAGVQLPGDAPALPPAEVAHHTWVQAAFGPDWKDLDPTLPGAQPGLALTTASQTLAQLSDDLRYRVRFDVLAERVEGGALATRTIFEYDDFADQLAGVPVTLSHVTPSSLKRLGLALNALLGEGWIEYRPALEVGDRTLVADDTVAFPLSGGGGGVLSAEPTPSGGPGGPVEGEATAEWIEITVTPPDGQPFVARRTVFDRIPAAERVTGAPAVDSVAPINLVALDGSGSVDFPPMLGVEAFAIATGPTDLSAAAAPGNGFGLFGLAYHALRDTMGADIELAAGVRTYTDGPDIASVSVQIDPNAKPRDLAQRVRFGVDLWQRSHGVLPLEGSSTTAAQARIVAGVTDHLAERFALETADGRFGSAARTIGVGEVFDAAAAQGVPTIVLHGSVPTTLPYTPSANESIAQAVGAGEVVVVPAKPVTIEGAQRIGWWTVDPRTGETIDTMDDGSASEFAEEGVIIRTRVGLVRCYGALALTVAGYLAAATSALTVMGILGTFKPGAGAGATCTAV